MAISGTHYSLTDDSPDVPAIVRIFDWEMPKKRSAYPDQISYTTVDGRLADIVEHLTDYVTYNGTDRLYAIVIGPDLAVNLVQEGALDEEDFMGAQETDEEILLSIMINDTKYTLIIAQNASGCYLVDTNKKVLT